MNRFAVLFAAVLTALCAPAAAAAAPANDGRNDAQAVTLPASVTGTVQGARLDDGESASPCALTRGSVWYRLDAKRTERLVALSHAAGDLDVAVDVYERIRSQQRLLACDIGDAHGNSAVGVTALRGHSYLIRVSRRAGSVSGTFRLSVRAAAGIPRVAPALPPGGVGGRVDSVDETAETWAVALTAGRRYRFALRHPGPGCLGTALYPPGRGSSGPAAATLGCGGYALYAPRRSGRYMLLVHAARGVSGPQRYQLKAGPAERDDSAPGSGLRNYQRATGSLGGLDRVDLYGFRVARRSVLFLNLQSGADLALQLLGADGKVIARGTTGALHKGLHRGRYFVAVRAGATVAGGYRLLRASRTITKTSLHVAVAALASGLPATVQTVTTPAVSGPVTVVFEQFDPLAGWQFVRAVRTTAVAGVAGVSWRPPAPGRWRATATYDGTRGQAPSTAGFARFEVGVA